MNSEIFGGICIQRRARVDEVLGRLSGDRLRAAVAHRYALLGRARERAGIAKQNGARQMKEFMRRNRYWNL